MIFHTVHIETDANCKQLVSCLYSRIGSFSPLSCTNLPVGFQNQAELSKGFYAMLEILDIFEKSSCGLKSVRTELSNSKFLNGFKKNVGSMKMFSPEHTLQMPFLLTTKSSRWSKEMNAYCRSVERNKVRYMT